MSTGQLFLFYPASLLSALFLWILIPRKRSFLFLLPALLPLLAASGLLARVTDSAGEISLPFLQLAQGISMEIRFLTNTVQLGLALLVSMLSFLIQLYSVRYLEKEDSQGYFHFLIAGFQLAMTGLFLSASLFSLLVFWELVGLFSYLLVQFWCRREGVAESALRVVLINKLGDFFLISGVGLLLSFGLAFPVRVNMVFPEGADVFLSSPTGQVICLFLFLSAAVKSAQFPFSVWLKRAMAGPTSVSALLHSATMVVAGVWLMSRLAPFLPEQILNIMAGLGMLSYLLGNLAALGSSQLKSTLAFSTMAQLGLMMSAIGCGAFDGVILHLISHALYKAGLFLLCGFLMHSLAEQGFSNQDAQSYSRLSGILSNSLWGKWILAILLAALAGLPFTSGFISKEALLPAPWISGNQFHWILFAGFQLGAFLTAVYAARIFIVLCLKEKKEPPLFSYLMVLPIFFTAAASGFWIFGINPFSSEGWLASFLGLKGHSIRPDFIAAFLGVAFAWKSRHSDFFRQYPSILIAVIQEFRPMEMLLNRVSELTMALASISRKTDEKFIDNNLNLASKSVVVAGYFSRFTDQFLIDGLLRMVGTFFYRIGGVLFFQARHSARFAAWMAILVLILLIYFSYYR